MSVDFYVINNVSMKPDRGPSANFANPNAADILRLLQLPTEPYGTLDDDQIPLVRRVILRLLNSPKARSAAVRDGSVSKNGRFHEMAQTDDRVCDRLRLVDSVLAHAQAISGRFVWS